jgi:hypothetical protein
VFNCISRDYFRDKLGQAQTCGHGLIFQKDPATAGMLRAGSDFYKGKNETLRALRKTKDTKGKSFFFVGSVIILVTFVLKRYYSTTLK